MAWAWLSKKIHTAWGLNLAASPAAAPYANPHTRTILFIGQTGAGKTTLLELFHNYERMVLARGAGSMTNEALDSLTLISKEQDRMAKDPAEKARRDQAERRMESITDTTDVYAIKMGPITLEIIDSPGFGDNRGVKQDKANVETLIEFLRTRNTIHGICIVVNGKETRSQVSLELALIQLSSVVPVKALENVFVMYTQCSSSFHRTFHPSVIAEKLGVSEAALEEGFSFFLDNPMGILKNVRAAGAKLKPRDRLSLQTTIDLCLFTMEDFIEFVGRLPPTPTKAFSELYDNQRNIEASLAAAYVNYEASKESERKQENLRQLLKEHELTAEQKRRLVEQARDRQCHSNCHIACELSQLEKGSHSFSRCKAFTNGPHCHECQHTASFHFHTFQQWESVNLLTPAMVKDWTEALETLEGRQQRLHQVEAHIELLKSAIDNCQNTLVEALKAFRQQATAPAWSFVLRNQIAALETRLRVMDNLDAADVPNVEVELEKLREQLVKVSQLEGSHSTKFNKLGSIKRVFNKMDDEDEKKDEQQETEVLQDSCSVPTAPDPAAQSQHKLPNVPVEVGSLDEPVRVESNIEAPASVQVASTITSKMKEFSPKPTFLPDIILTSALQAVMTKNRLQIESESDEEFD